MDDLISIVIPTKDRKEALNRLIKSIRESSYKNIEMIVVNNGGKFVLANKKIKLINNRKNLGLAFARNMGVKEAKGKFVLFIDDDNEVDRNMINELAKVLSNNKDIIAVGPITYYLSSKSKLWFLGATYNFATSIPHFYKEKLPERMMEDKLFITDNLHNCFMVRRSVGEKVGWFDEEIFMGGTELDFFQKIKKIIPPIRLATCIKAKCYHDVPLRSKNLLRSLGFDNELRVFYFQRNRGLLVNRYGKLLQKLIFGILFYPIFLVGYGFLFIYYRRWDFLREHLKATKEGYRYLIKVV